MALLPYSWAKPLLFCLDAEKAHHLTLSALERIQHTPLVSLISQTCVNDPVEIAGLRFPNRVGMAAGLDKNGRCIDGLAALGFGFIEVGTVTPRPQPGNPQPRIFRLPRAQALINRLGFNNEGLDVFVRNVQKAQFRQKGGILGLNIGKNADTPMERAVDDYLLGLTGVYPHADYITVNISSPNTKNLRNLQTDEALEALLGALVQRRQELTQTSGRQVPLFVKIAPDLSDEEVQAVARILIKMGIDGVIATNTTLSRAAVAGLPHANEAGGLSGAPVFEASNRVVRVLRASLGPKFPIIGVGGILRPEDAVAKVQAGADLVQIYTGFIYGGPSLVPALAQALAERTQ